jgi:hypothetical protein
MSKTQPSRDDEKLHKALGLEEPTEEELELRRQVVSVKIVDEMFDDILGEIEEKPSLSSRIFSSLHRAKEHLRDTAHMLRNLWRWRSLFKAYYPWDINRFLPLFVKHLELYIEHEKTQGVSTEAWIEHKTSTAQEAVDILKRLMDDDYEARHLKTVKDKWGQFPYEQTRYGDGSTSYKHLTPEGYDAEITAAYEKGQADENRDLKRLGELIEKYMLDWWD